MVKTIVNERSKYFKICKTNTKMKNQLFKNSVPVALYIGQVASSLTVFNMQHASRYATLISDFGGVVIVLEHFQSKLILLTRRLQSQIFSAINVKQNSTSQ